MKTTESFKELQHKSTKRLAVWTMIWVLSTALATFGPEMLWENSLYTYAGVALFLITGAAMIFGQQKTHFKPGRAATAHAFRSNGH